MPRILIVDDDPDIRRLLCDYLAQDGLEVVEAKDGPSALDAFHRSSPDLIILDVMMPGFDGMEVCRRIRMESPAPIIFLTGKADEVDQLLGFGFGADDYVTKPFSPRTLVARVKALLRRSAGPQSLPARMVSGSLVMDTGAFTVTLDGAAVDLTSKEFLLLKYLMERPGRVLTKRQLVTGAWNEEYLGDDSVLMVHLSHLRQKLNDDPNDPRWIRTVRGVGYKFSPGGEV